MQQPADTSLEKESGLGIAWRSAAAQGACVAVQRSAGKHALWLKVLSDHTLITQECRDT